MTAGLEQREEAMGHYRLLKVKTTDEKYDFVQGREIN